MTELKAGESLDFIVGDKTLTIEPVPFGNVKKILKIVYAASKEIAGGQIESIIDLVDKNLFQVLPLMFRNGRYPFLTQEWVEDNLTVPALRKMVEAAAVVNGMRDFFEKAGGKITGIENPQTQTIPPAKPGSTTSSE